MLNPDIGSSTRSCFAGLLTALAAVLTIPACAMESGDVKEPGDAAAHEAEAAPEDQAGEAGRALKGLVQNLRSRSLNGGYGGYYPPGSKPDDITKVRIQHPGTPNIGQCLLRGHDLLGDQDLLDAAKEAGRALAWYQSKTGGWPIKIEELTPTPPPDDAGMARLERQRRPDALDDNATQGSLDFLLDLDERIDAPWLEDAIVLGLDYLLESQLEAGGWPQYYPLIGGYHDFYTFNDGATNNAIEVMLKAHERRGDPRFLESALKGAAFIAASQLPPPQSGWAQQYDWDLKPAHARAFEPAALSSSSTSRNILTLLDIAAHTGDLDHLKPIPAAIAWLEATRLDEKTWARFYEIGTDRPIYPSRSGRIVDSLAELPPGESKRYAYVAGFRAKEAIDLYRQLTEAKNGEAHDFRVWRERRSNSEAKAKAGKSAQKLGEVLAYAEQQRAQPDGGRILLGDVIGLCDTVLNYLEFNEDF